MPMINEINQMPLVSVGIPTYNRPDGLKLLLQCITAQTYKNLEIIISDNGSEKGDTEAVARSFLSSDARVRYYKQEVNKGPIYNFNFVLEKASGDYFMWAADDDEFKDNYIEVCMRFLISHPDYALACGKALYYQEGKQIYLGVAMNLPQNSNYLRVLSYFSKVRDNAAYYGVMRRDQMLRVPYRNQMGSDWHFISGICFMGKVIALDKTAVKRNIGGTSASLKNIARVLGLSDFEANYPYLSIATNATKNILWRDKIYSTMCFVSRLYLASIIFFLLIWRYIILVSVKRKVLTYSLKIMPFYIINKYRTWKKQNKDSGYPYG